MSVWFSWMKTALIENNNGNFMIRMTESPMSSSHFQSGYSDVWLFKTIIFSH